MYYSEWDSIYRAYPARYKLEASEENKKPAQSADSSESRYDTRESGLVPAIMIAVQKTLSRVWGVNNFLDRGLAGNRTPKILVPTQIPYHTEPTVFLVYQK